MAIASDPWLCARMRVSAPSLVADLRGAQPIQEGLQRRRKVALEPHDLTQAFADSGGDGAAGHVLCADRMGCDLWLDRISHFASCPLCECQHSAEGLVRWGGRNVHFYTFGGTNRGGCTSLYGPGAAGHAWCHAWCGVAGPDYFNRQAATLLKFAKAVADREVAAGLVEKAADLKGAGRTTSKRCR